MIYTKQDEMDEFSELSDTSISSGELQDVSSEESEGEETDQHTEQVKHSQIKLKGSISELGKTKASITKPRGNIKDYVWRVEYVLDQEYWHNMIECTNHHGKDDPEWTKMKKNDESIAKLKGWHAIHL